jgi:hypothetical protein
MDEGFPGNSIKKKEFIENKKKLLKNNGFTIKPTIFVNCFK